MSVGRVSCRLIGWRARASSIRSNTRNTPTACPPSSPSTRAGCWRAAAVTASWKARKNFSRFIVIEFPTLEAGVACFQSKEYQEAAAFRRGGAGEVENVIVDGGDATV